MNTCVNRAAIEVECPARKNQTTPWPPSGPGRPCQCINFLHCRGVECFPPKMRYVQPDRTMSYAPEKIYKKSDGNVSSDTVYKLSYFGHDADAASKCRADPFKLTDNLAPSGDFSSDTTHKMSYPGWPCAEHAEPVYHGSKLSLGDGPPESQTTQRHDYTKKPFCRTDPIIPCALLKPSDQPMDDTSTMFASYQPPDPCELEPAMSFQPSRIYKQPDSKFDNGTIHKMSYVPWPLHDKEIYPWAQKPKYRCPQSPMEANTIYNTSYLPSVNCGPPTPFAPPDSGNVITSDTTFNDGTIYNKSYLPVECHRRPDAVRAVDNLMPSDSQFAHDTTHKMSYPGWPCVEPQEQIIHGGQFSLGDGPMQSQTTQRHDYTPKAYSKTDSIFPCDLMKHSDQPMEDTSTMFASYQAPDRSELDPAMLFAPSREYKKPESKFEGGTVHNMSYVPWPLKNKEYFPWAAKPKYNAPQSAMAGDTVYKMSYEPPGHFVPNDMDPNCQLGCNCCYPGECLPPC